jgi:hypothetical protein
MVQFLPFWDDVTISFLAFSLLKQQEQTMRLFIINYLWLFYAPVNLTFFFIFHLLVITLITIVNFRSNCQQN